MSIFDKDHHIFYENNRIFYKNNITDLRNCLYKHGVVGHNFIDCNHPSCTLKSKNILSRGIHVYIYSNMLNSCTEQCLTSNTQPNSMHKT